MSAVDCDCDFVDELEMDGRRIQVHHVIPDDGAPHSESLACGCGPQIHWIDTDLLVVDHLDQDLDPDAFADD